MIEDLYNFLTRVTQQQVLVGNEKAFDIAAAQNVKNET